MIEFAIFLPMVVILALGVIEVSWALLDGHVVTRLAREGSNLISRDASLTVAAQTMQSMRARPVDFNNGSSKIIFSVLRNVDTVGAANYDRAILYQRYEYGTFPGASKLNTAGGGSFPAPDYQATNPNGNTGLQVTNLPPGMTVTLGGYVYVTEIYSQHQRLTPFDRLGISMPQTLYSIAYF
jgi:Flp pilus assembly protein TadG